MDKKSDEQFIVMKFAIESNNQEMKTNNQCPNDKIMKLTENFKAMLVSSTTSITDQINALKYSPTQKDSPNPPELTSVVHANRRATRLDGGKYTKLVECGL